MNLRLQMSDKWKILLPDQMDETGPNRLTDIAELTWLSEYGDQMQVLDDIHVYDAILARGDFDVTSKLIHRADNLKVISKHGVGVDNIDVDAASERDIIVCNTPGANSQAVAEHAMGLVLAVRKKLSVANAQTGKIWNRERYCSPELRGATLGIFGCGDIGRRVASFGNAFGMRCVVYDPYITENEIPSHTDRVTNKHDLFDTADIVSVHCPLTPETRNAITADELSRLPASGFIVNTARGGIINEEDLVDLLQRGELAGAGVDVFASEPIPSGHQLLELENVVTTPHIAGTSDEAMRAKSIRAAEHINQVYNENIPESTINLMHFCEDLNRS